MTFKQQSKFNFINQEGDSCKTKKSSLQEIVDEPLNGEAESIVKDLKIFFFDYEKLAEKIKGYEKKIHCLNNENSTNDIDSIKSDINSIESIYKQIITLITKLKETDTSEYNIKSKSLECFKTVNNKIRPKHEDIKMVIKNILNVIKPNDMKKQTQTTKKYSFIKTSEGSRSGNELSSKLTFQAITDEPLLSQNLILVRDNSFNNEIMNQREVELREIQKVSSQVKAMTTEMNKSTQNQGKLLNYVESNVSEAKSNAFKADQEIIVADKSLSSSRKTLLRLFAFLIVIIGLTLIVVYLRT